MISLEALAIGDAPLSYQWQLESIAIPRATNAGHTLSSLAETDTGSYSVVAANPAGTTTSRVAVVRMRTSAFPLVWSDDFEIDTATNWNVFWGAANGLPDYTADFSFDHSATPYTHNGITLLIPAAPTSAQGSTRALKLTVNRDTMGANATVNLYPKNLHLSGSFALKFDLWINYPGDALGINSTGSTQHALCGINHFGTNVNWATTIATASDGLWFAASGEGGDSRDYRCYVGNVEGPPVDLTGSPTSGLIATNHTAAVFQTVFPVSRFETAGAPGKNWVQVEVHHVGSTVIWLIDGVALASRTNVSTFTSGTIMLGLMDVFPSIANPARDSFVLIDNVRVENLVPPIRFESIQHRPNGEVTLQLSSALGDSFWLDASGDLSDWLPLTTVRATNQPSTFTDTDASNSAIRFYRGRR
jgi:hypothetical protein